MKTMNTLPVHLPYLNTVFRISNIILIVTCLTFPSVLPVSEHASRGVMLGMLVGFSRTDLQIPKNSPTIVPISTSHTSITPKSTLQELQSST